LRRADRIHGVIHPYVGQEAIATGVSAALSPRDRLVSNHRGHGHLLARGADPGRMMAELFGRVDGYCRGMGGSMHIADFDLGIIGANGIVGAGLPLAVGSALTSRLRERDEVVTACFFGDGATGEGTFHEAMNLSAIDRLPVLWVCENNQYAAETPLERTLPTGKAISYAAGYGMWAEEVDGTDVAAVAAAAADAVERIRHGNGPAFLEVTAYRFGVHAQRLAPVAERRPEREREMWRSRDPIASFASRLVADGLATPSEVDERLAGAERIIDDAVAFAVASPYPSATLETVGAAGR
jgi:TPP-dependent pyruvate/acetoin dehydrogenase alpha subunit